MAVLAGHTVIHSDLVPAWFENNTPEHKVQFVLEMHMEHSGKNLEHKMH